MADQLRATGRLSRDPYGVAIGDPAPHAAEPRPAVWLGRGVHPIGAFSVDPDVAGAAAPTQAQSDGLDRGDPAGLVEGEWDWHAADADLSEVLLSTGGSPVDAAGQPSVSDPWAIAVPSELDAAARQEERRREADWLRRVYAERDRAAAASGARRRRGGDIRTLAYDPWGEGSRAAQPVSEDLGAIDRRSGT